MPIQRSKAVVFHHDGFSITVFPAAELNLPASRSIDFLAPRTFDVDAFVHAATASAKK